MKLGKNVKYSYFYLYNTLQYADNNAFFSWFLCLEMEKIKPVYAPKDFFEVHVLLKLLINKEQGLHSLEKSLNFMGYDKEY